MRLRKTNTSGYRGVSWSKSAGKWEAHIRVDGKRHNLGLFKSAEEASGAYEKAALELRGSPVPVSLEVAKAQLIEQLRALYASQGIVALSTRFLEKQPDALYPRLLKAGLSQTEFLAELGLADEYARWRDSNRTYRGQTKSKWTWEVAVAKAAELMKQEGDLPTVEWCRVNGYSSMVSAVFNSSHTWEDLRLALGSFATSNFCVSRNGMRWRSRPEASFSNFLYARAIEHKRGERYAEGYSEQSGRRYGRYDLHFRAKDGEWVDVEIWGDELNKLSGGRYQVTRAHKERWEANNDRFLGVSYKDCHHDSQLAEILGPFIGIVEPSQFDKPQDHFIETAHWTDADELLQSCRELAATMPDGIFPGESWLRRRGKFVDRPGPAYNTLAVRVNQWIGGVRKVRQLLGQGDASTTAWTQETAIQAWRDFEAKYGLSPSQVPTRARKEAIPVDVIRRANTVREACRRHGVMEMAQAGKTARQVKWTPEAAITAWRDFTAQHGITPSTCLSIKNRKAIPEDVRKLAIRIYSMTRYLGLLDVIKDG